MATIPVDGREQFAWLWYHGLMQKGAGNGNTVAERVLNPFSECFTPEVAQKIADFRADRATHARLDELAAKANEGLLTDTERAEYDAYIEVIDFIAILQAKARSLLKAARTSDG